MRLASAPDTIAAISTPSGHGGIGIVRISGPNALAIATTISRQTPQPRIATFAPFVDANGDPIDEGIVLYFARPRSFTGEETVELQGHGGPAVMDALLRRTLELGARRARPGEFSERAFLNGRIDLAQAEGIADLIAATHDAAARGAMRSLAGAFSERVEGVATRLTELRAFLEAALDFPDDELDLLARGDVAARTRQLLHDLTSLRRDAFEGVLLTRGATVVLSGRPNVGKSTLLNALTGDERAIVTPIAGTTRDLIRADVVIDGIPIQFIDTAGLQESTDPVEQEGIARARREIGRADLVLQIVDTDGPFDSPSEPGSTFPAPKTIVVWNKEDLADSPNFGPRGDDDEEVAISARDGQGLEALRHAVLRRLGHSRTTGGTFSARQRHVDAIDLSRAAVERALVPIERDDPVLAAEDLRLALDALGQITGRITSDDLLGEIFSRFCIGK